MFIVSTSQFLLTARYVSFIFSAGDGVPLQLLREELMTPVVWISCGGS